MPRVELRGLEARARRFHEGSIRVLLGLYKGSIRFLYVSTRDP